MTQAQHEASMAWIDRELARHAQPRSKEPSLAQLALFVLSCVILAGTGAATVWISILLTKAYLS